MKIARPFALLLLFALGIFNANPGYSEVEPVKNELVMAFVPSRDTNTVQFSADRIAEYLSKETGYAIRALTVSNYAAVIVGMSTNRIDLAFVGPLSYVVANKKNGAYPITAAIRNGTKGYHGIIITRKDSDIKSLGDLKGKTFAFGDVLSTSANLYPKSALIEHGIDPVKDIRSVTVSSQPSIVSAVINKKVHAGAVYYDARTKPEILNMYPDAIESTTVLYKTGLIPADPQIVRAGMNPSQVAMISQSLLRLSSDTNGKKWLKELFDIDSLVTVTDSDYEELRKVISVVKPELLD